MNPTHRIPYFRLPPLRLRPALGFMALLIGLQFPLPEIARAQVIGNTGVLEGRVVQSRSGQGVAGAQVQIVGTGLGTLTGPDGRFRLSDVPAGEIEVRAQRIGLATVTTAVTVQTGSVVSVELVMAERAVDLDAIVVTGQGAEISRRRLSTGVDVISREQIQASSAMRLDELLQTALPSVQVRLASGQPGATSVTRGRGPVSATRATTPVIYVDGVRVDNLNTRAELSLNTSGNRHQGTQTSSIADIPLENIERIEYVPGGAATTLFGSDAANGVIQIFTSKGAPGDAEFSVETEVGVESVNREYFYFPQTVDLLYRNGLRQQHRLSASGGSEGMTWSVSGSLADREGFRIANNASRSYQLRTGLSAQIRPTVQLSGSFSYGHNAYERTRDGNAGGYAPLWLLEAGRSFALGFNNDLAAASASELNELRDFVTQAEALQNNRVRVARVQAAQTLRWTPRADLAFNATIGLDQRTSNERGILTNEFLVHTRVWPAGTDNRGSISSYDRRFLGLTMEAGGQHTWDRGILSLVTSGGAQLFRDHDEQASRIAENVRDGSETVRGAGVTTADDFLLQVVNYGTYLQQNWGFYDRYFVDIGLRADGNTAFGEDVGAQLYPKIGFAWDLSRESFLDGLTRDGALRSLRLRGNYGVAGNFPPPFTRDRTVDFASYLGQQSASFGQPGNTELGPERTATVEMGIEAELFQDRLSVQLGYYDARTTDALFIVPASPSSGEAAQFRNVGEIANRGLELSVSAEVLRSDRFSARISGSINTLNNEVVSAGGSPVFNISGFSTGTVQAVVQEGFPLGSLRGNFGTLNPDGTIASFEPLQFLGKPLPDQFGTLGLDLSIGRSLRMRADADWQRGAQLHSFDRQFRYLHGLADPSLPSVLTDSPRFRTNWLQITNLFVEDTDYLLVRNISATWLAPSDRLGGWARGLEVTAGVQNPFGWWTSSFNPESDHSGAINQGGASVGGFNYGSDPSPRTLLTRVRVRF